MAEVFELLTLFSSSCLAVGDTLAMLDTLNGAVVLLVVLPKRSSLRNPREVGLSMCVAVVGFSDVFRTADSVSLLDMFDLISPKS
jgi:hypothetical protein